MRMHALLTQATAEALLARLSEQGVPVSGNPDVLVFRFTDMSVDDARLISSYASLKAVSGAKYLVVSFDRAGVEAQNALLKVVEEAPGNSHFYFSTPNPGALIPTLRSRCVTEQVTGEVTEHALVAEFLAASYADRLSLVEKLVTKAQRTQDRGELKEFVRALVHTLPVRETLDAVRYLNQNGSSPKLVLSHLAVVLPKV